MRKVSGMRCSTKQTWAPAKTKTSSASHCSTFSADWFWQCSRFYVLQLLHPIGNNSQSLLYTHWGRVGEDGQSQRKVVYTFVSLSWHSLLRMLGPLVVFDRYQWIQETIQSQSWCSLGKSCRHGSQKRCALSSSALHTYWTSTGKYMWLGKCWMRPVSPLRYTMLLARDFEEEETKSSDADKAGSSKKDEAVVIPDSTLEAEIQVSLLYIILRLIQLFCHRFSVTSFSLRGSYFLNPFHDIHLSLDRQSHRRSLVVHELRC